MSLSTDVLTQNEVFGTASGETSGGRGGALYSTAGTLTITGCQINNNQALGGTSSAGIAGGGGVYVLNGNAIVGNSTISGNLAQGGQNGSDGEAHGGGIEAYNANLALSNSTISGNTAQGGSNSGSGGGGAGALTSASAARSRAASYATTRPLGEQAVITGLALEAPSPTTGPSLLRLAISVATSLGAVTAAAMAAPLAAAYMILPPLRPSPIAPSVTMWPAGNNAPGNYGEGGAIEIDNVDASAVITRTTFTANQAIGGNGGIGGYDGEGAGGAIANFGSLSVINGTFNQNQRLEGTVAQDGPGNTDPGVDTAYGGAIDSGFEPTTNSIANSTFSYNQAIGGNNGSATGTDIVEVGDAEGSCDLLPAGLSKHHFQLHPRSQFVPRREWQHRCGPVVDVGAPPWGRDQFRRKAASISTTRSPSATAPSIRTAPKAATTIAGPDAAWRHLSASASVEAWRITWGVRFASTGARSATLAAGGQHNNASGSGALFANLGAGGGIFNYLGNYNSSGYGPL